MYFPTVVKPTKLKKLKHALLEKLVEHLKNNSLEQFEVKIKPYKIKICQMPPNHMVIQKFSRGVYPPHPHTNPHQIGIEYTPNSRYTPYLFYFAQDTGGRTNIVIDLPLFLATLSETLTRGHGFKADNQNFKSYVFSVCM